MVICTCMHVLILLKRYQPINQSINRYLRRCRTGLRKQGQRGALRVHQYD